MIKRIGAILGVLLASGAIAVVAIAIWPESAGNGDTQSTSSQRSASLMAGANGVRVTRVRTRSGGPDRLASDL